MARVVVTGASGFIGKYLVPKLRSVAHEVIEAGSTEGDVADEATWSRFPDVEVVVHLAGRTFVPDSWIDPAGFLRTNLQGTVLALDYCRTHDARLVFLSSYLYGKPEKMPIPESAALSATNPYALSKKLAEDACRFYADAFGVRVTVLRPFNVFGPDQAKHFLIPTIIDQAAAGNVIHVKDLEPKRDYVYIDDLADAIERSMVLDQAFNIFNIGTGISYSVADLISLIQSIMGTNLAVQSSGERRAVEVMDTKADIERASAILGWSPKWTLKAGLEKVLGA